MKTSKPEVISSNSTTKTTPQETRPETRPETQPNRESSTAQIAGGEWNTYSVLLFEMLRATFYEYFIYLENCRSTGIPG